MIKWEKGFKLLTCTPIPTLHSGSIPYCWQDDREYEIDKTFILTSPCVVYESYADAQASKDNWLVKKLGYNWTYEIEIFPCEYSGVTAFEENYNDSGVEAIWCLAIRVLPSFNPVLNWECSQRKDGDYSPRV